MRNRKVCASKRAGFSLIEVTIALLILGFGLLTVSSAQIHAMRAGQDGRHKTRAVAIAQSQMEQLQRLRWTPELNATAWTVPVTVNTSVQAPNNMVERAYSVSWRITNVIPNRMRAIDVRVSWVSATRGNVSYVVSSNRFNYEGL